MVLGSEWIKITSHKRQGNTIFVQSPFLKSLLTLNVIVNTYL